MTMLIKREKYSNKITQSIDNMPITVLIGARQVGKTSLLESIETHYTVHKLDGQLQETNNLIEYLKTKQTNQRIIDYR